MPDESKSQSLREYVLESIGNFLYKEGFQPNDITPLGILEAINLISDYHEEGVSLFPEIIITNSLEFFKTIPNKEVLIAEGDLSVDEFKKAIKLCAPLAVDSWVIFIEITDTLRYGVLSAEMTETSFSIYDQTVGALKVTYEKTTIAYIRNIGQKTVELSGLKNRLTVSLTLDAPTAMTFNEVCNISKQISSKCDESFRRFISPFFEKIITAALRIGHGNLIGVIDESEEVYKKLFSTERNGTYLPIPLDFERLIIDAEEEKSNETSVNLKAHASLLKSMLNHDGITVFTNKGRLVAYHLLINTYEKEGQTLIGGARTKAFSSMQNSGLFLSCFYKSHDGNMKIWIDHE